MYKFQETFSPAPSRVHEIDWYNYTNGLKKAMAENKLILLVSSASWCYWCHVLDETTLSDPEIIEIIKRNLIAIRVDVDREPDVDIRYNQSGLPLVLVLSPHGITLGGGNFFTATELKTLIEEASRFMNTQRAYYFQVKEDFEKKVEELRKEKAETPEDFSPNRTVKDVIIQALMSIDSENSGFGEEPKFPFSEMLDFLLSYAEKADEPELYEMPVAILEKMASSELFDRIEGGFFRYCRGKDWTNPQTDKHLFDNAYLIQVYSKAASQSNRELFKEIVDSTISMLEKNLLNEFGLFGIAIDAGDEYYSLNAEERSKSSQKPRCDLMPVTAYNSRLAAALIEASRAFNDSSYYEKAQQILDRLIELHLNDSEPSLPFRNPEIKGFFLSDTAEFINALLSAGLITNEKSTLKLAADIYRTAKNYFFDEKKRLFLDRYHSTDDIGALELRYTPFYENSLMAQNAVRLIKAGLLPEAELSTAKDVLAILSLQIEDLKAYSGSIGRAALELYEEETYSKPDEVEVN